MTPANSRAANSRGASFPDDLLGQAERLLQQGRPRQAALRRAVSTAYYALFHLLIEEATRRCVRPASLRAAAGRMFDHGAMTKASGEVPAGQADDQRPFAPERVVKLVARTFVKLQEARHRADYNLTSPFGREEAETNVRDARDAFVDWRQVRSTAAAADYLERLFLSIKERRDGR